MESNSFISLFFPNLTSREMLYSSDGSISESARLAQSVERGTFNPKVKGSSPLSGVYHS